MKKLFVLTYEYPYGVGEQFFESEISFLSQSFDVTIFSVTGSSKVEPTRKYPEDVHVFPLDVSKNKRKHFIKGLLLNLKKFEGEFSNFNEKLLFRYYLSRQLTIRNRINKLIKKNKLEISNCIFYSYWLSFAYSFSLVKENIEKKYQTHIPLVSRTHRYDLFWEAMPRNYRGLQRLAIKAVDVVYSVSQMGCDYLANKYPEFSNKLKTMRLGTFDHGFSKMENDFSFLTCSNNRKVKRLDLFAKAFSLFCQKHKSAIWHAIGLTGNEHEILDALGDSVKNVHFYGMIKNSDVIDFYKTNNISCFVNVSSSEGLPVSIMEAMSFGVPILATDAGGAAELVSSDNGVFLPCDINEQDVYEAMESIASLNKDKFSQLSNNSRLKWEKFVNADSNYKAWVQVLEQLK